MSQIRLQCVEENPKDRNWEKRGQPILFKSLAVIGRRKAKYGKKTKIKSLTCFLEGKRDLLFHIERSQLKRGV